ncbi:MAG: heparan-alpha-glucosaminide N-acetyltransferase domain-containing protein [Saprospiraceae bacterium]
MNRIGAVDLARGLVMIIMALDHVRDLMYIHSINQSPTNLATTTTILFFTRWITYLCAPTFVFLAGTSAYISSRNKNISEIRMYLIKRGLWLVFLEFTVFNFALYFDIGFHNYIFEVIAAIGFGLIMLGVLIRVQSKIIGLIGLIIIFCHNLLPLIPFEEGSIIKIVLSPFFAPGRFPVSGESFFFMAYPPVPWLGIILIGFAAGTFFELQDGSRKKLFSKIGFAALGLFILIRFINIYGDPIPWTNQKNSLFTFLSFINITKYPPSLLFCLITLGLLFLFLAYADGLNKRVFNLAAVYGKVPLFYFILHFYFIHLIMIFMLLIQGFDWSQLDFSSGTFGRPQNAESGISLWVVYIIWIIVVAALYKPCLWFGNYKASHKEWWLKYM